MGEIKQILIRRLEKLGVELSLIPGFIRSLANSLDYYPYMNLPQVNERLHYMGWDEFDLDYHTLQLVVTCFENEGMKRTEYKSAYWFEVNFMPNIGFAGEQISGLSSEQS